MNDTLDGYEPTETLRLARRRDLPDRLQQRWRKPRSDRLGYFYGWDYEWRDVPVELVD